MTNIWGFLSQTMEVTLVAAVILLLKIIMKDKLSPRWQYGVWAVLPLAMVMPVGKSGRYIVRTVQLWLQAVKTLVETKLNSRFIGAEQVVYNTSFLPVLQRQPASITDWLFVIYVAGVVIILIKYLLGYIRLQMIIAGADDAGRETTGQIQAVADKYNLKPCRAKLVAGRPSAFVSGIFRPVLVLPGDMETDHKVILHELLHLKNKDLWQKVVWSLFRTLHWPNVLLQVVFSIIDNDMESLCDQRVMELLQGEDRREYGRILLAMTNEKYPSAFGTTSISNGAAFIAERIKNIARFKKYPRGVGIVSVCIVIMLLPLAASAGTWPDVLHHINSAKHGLEYQMQIENYRITQCQTIDGAIDVYAKALTFFYDESMLAVQPTGIETEDYTMIDWAEYNLWDNDILYFALNVQKIDDSNYTAQLMFKDFYHNDVEAGDYGTNYYIVPIGVIKQNGWKVYQMGDYQLYRLEGVIDHLYSAPPMEEYTGGITYEHQTEYGTVQVRLNNISYDCNTKNIMASLPNLEFDARKADINVNFIPNEKAQQYGSAAVGVGTLKSVASEYDSAEVSRGCLGMQEVGTSTSGPEGYYSLTNTTMKLIMESRDGVLSNGLNYHIESFDWLPTGLQVDIWLENVNVTTFKIDLQAGEIVE